MKSCPCTRAKKLTWRDCPKGSHVCIGRVLPYSVAPPLDVNAAFRKLHGEEDQDETGDEARVKSRGKQVVVPHPPTEVVASHEELEKATDDCRHYNVDAIEGWNLVGCNYRDGDVNVAPECSGITEGE
jgi:hypothetical protein